MKSPFIFILAVSFVLCTQANAAKNKVATSGSGCNSVIIIDKESGAIEKTYPLQKGDECNSVVVTKKGNVLYSYKKGARMVSPDGSTIWEYPVSQGREVQSVSQTSKGYILGICGTPAMIVELDKNGIEVNSIQLKIETKSVHGQFRQITPLKNGTFLIPVMSKGEIMHIDKNGDAVRPPVKVKGNLFAVVLDENKNYVVSTGDNHAVVVVDPSNGKVVREITRDQIKGAVLGFVAQVTLNKNGGMTICNWLGHGADRTQAHIIEIDKNGKLLWSYTNPTHQQGASTVYEFTSN